MRRKEEHKPGEGTEEVVEGGRKLSEEGASE
jgi:hypothetical protein